MTAHPRDSPGISPPQAATSLARLLHGGALCALAGVAVALVISYLHARLDAAGGGYTSFCNISSSINCDRVLTSPFAQLLGVPVAWLAVPAYGLIGLLLLATARRTGPAARRALLLASFAVAGATAFSAYMAFVSFYVLGTVCLMCTALYALTALLFAIAVAAVRRSRDAWPQSQPPLGPRTVIGALVASLLVVAGVARATWPSAASLPAGYLSLTELRTANPDFYDWYTALPVVEPPCSDRHGLGEPDAPVTIVEFSDFECGFCRKNHAELSDLVSRRPGEVRVVYRHFPLDASCNDAVPQSIHLRACRAAEAAECAGLQGRFGDMATALFDRQKQLFETNLFRIAEHISLDMARFRTCMEERETLPLVLADCGAGKRLNLDSTPTLFINGRKVVGSLSEHNGYDYAIMIEARLKEGEAPPQG